MARCEILSDTKSAEHSKTVIDLVLQSWPGDTPGTAKLYENHVPLKKPRGDTRLTGEILSRHRLSPPSWAFAFSVGNLSDQRSKHMSTTIYPEWIDQWMYHDEATRQRALWTGRPAVSKINDKSWSLSFQDWPFDADWQRQEADIFRNSSRTVRDSLHFFCRLYRKVQGKHLYVAFWSGNVLN